MCWVPTRSHSLLPPPYHGRLCRIVALQVFLQHVNVLLELDDFVELWGKILDYLQRYMQAGSELAEAVPESLKNMLNTMTGI